MTYLGLTMRGAFIPLMRRRGWRAASTLSTQTIAGEGLPPKKFNVGFLLFPGATLMDFAGATEVFAFADNFSFQWIAPTLDPIQTSEFVSVLPTATFHEHNPVDVFFVPGGPAGGPRNSGNPGVIDVLNDPTYMDFVHSMTEKSRWSGSVCSGAFILAAAGAFDGCEVTTYWSFLETLKLFPKLSVDTTCYPRYLVDRERRRFSGGGVSSSIDLALELVRVLVGGKEGDHASQSAQLRVQYAPNPPFNAGDPSQPHISSEFVRQIRAAQEETAIKPMREAVQSVLRK